MSTLLVSEVTNIIQMGKHIQSKEYEMHKGFVNIPLRNAKGKSETMHKT